MSGAFWRRGGSIRPGLRALLFLALLVVLALVWLGAWLAFWRLTAGLTLGTTLRRLNTLTIYLIATAAAASATWLCGRFLDRSPRPDLGLPLARSALPQMAAGLLAGVAMQVTLYLAGLLSGAYTARINAAPGAAFLWYVLVMLFVALGEELVFRGYLLRRLTDSLGRRPAALLTAALFAAPHLDNPGAWGMAAFGLFALGLLFAWAVQEAGSLWPVIGLHWAWNVMEGAVLGLPNSGVAERFALIATQVEGPAWWTGGAFGPEAGAISLITIPLGFLILRRRHSPVGHRIAG